MTDTPQAERVSRPFPGGSSLTIQYFSRKPLLRRKQHYFRVVARNGKILVPSEGYNNFNDMMDTITVLRIGMAGASITRVEG